MLKRLMLVFVAVLLLDVGAACAGTIGMSGLWTFDGTAANSVSTMTISGEFDFDAGTVDLVSDDAFFGFFATFSGTISDNLDGTYDGILTYQWSTTTEPAVQYWDITDLGNGTASVVSHLVSIPELDPIIIEGTLSAVPLPGTLWLLGSGLFGLVGLKRQKK